MVGCQVSGWSRRDKRERCSKQFPNMELGRQEDRVRGWLLRPPSLTLISVSVLVLARGGSRYTDEDDEDKDTQYGLSP